MPSEIVCDNGSQFKSDKTEAFCRQWNITLVKSTPRYPQANGQAESSNKILINNFKKILRTRDYGLKNYHGSYGPTERHHKTLRGQTPFSLVYRTEVVLPTDVMKPMTRYSLTMSESNKEQLVHDLDTIDELRDMARIRMASYQ